MWVWLREEWEKLRTVSGSTIIVTPIITVGFLTFELDLGHLTMDIVTIRQNLCDCINLR